MVGKTAIGNSWNRCWCVQHLTQKLVRNSHPKSRTPAASFKPDVKYSKVLPRPSTPQLKWCSSRSSTRHSCLEIGTKGPAAPKSTRPQGCRLEPVGSTTNVCMGVGHSSKSTWPIATCRRLRAVSDVSSACQIQHSSTWRSAQIVCCKRCDNRKRRCKRFDHRFLKSSYVTGWVKLLDPYMENMGWTNPDINGVITPIKGRK